MASIPENEIVKKDKKMELVHEKYGGEPYEYYPIGKYVVVAPGVCGGRPTFKYTRLEVTVVLSLVASGKTIDEVVEAYSLSNLTHKAVQEAIHLAGQALTQSAQTIHPVAV